MEVSEISKRDIVDILSEGLYEGKFDYSGRLDETSFLNRLVNLNEFPSEDSRFETMAQDIWQHTINNNDWDVDWILYDKRLNLLHNDELFVKFVEQIFHPIVRDKGSSWKEYFDKINEVLEFDKLHLIPTKEISGRAVFTIEPIKNSELIANYSEQIENKFSSEYIDSQVSIMLEKNPNISIGKSKELLESCAKTILKELGVEYDETMKFAPLLRRVMEELGLSANDQNKENEAGKISSKILGNLGAIPQSMAALRNLFGDGHGKSSTFVSLPPRYARLAVGTSVAIVYFLWETYQDRKSIF